MVIELARFWVWQPEQKNGGQEVLRLADSHAHARSCTHINTHTTKTINNEQ